MVLRGEYRQTLMLRLGWGLSAKYGGLWKSQ